MPCSQTYGGKPNLRRIKMESVSFTLPTIGTAAMTAQDQINVTVNQATAVIVAAYLDHLNKLSAVVAPGSQSSANLSVASQAELVSLVNEVQTALRTV
jgi:hypothetical protein